MTKRPRDPNQLAKAIVGIATGEVEDRPPVAAKVKAGKKGGKARSRVLTPQQRSEIAQAGADARWKKR
ncbi:histone H1 [Pseudolabrys sp. FHR47]|uniref:histone H1 n=1 Tax=Pseudolabrys sp. FHR47 TaxID=2562284 RepID=UPI0010BEB328|nr:histone H1 [Pseudolabrys sp. FHR47]